MQTTDWRISQLVQIRDEIIERYNLNISQLKEVYKRYNAKLIEQMSLIKIKIENDTLYQLNQINEEIESLSIKKEMKKEIKTEQMIDSMILNAPILGYGNHRKQNKQETKYLDDLKILKSEPNLNKLLKDGIDTIKLKAQHTQNIQSNIRNIRAITTSKQKNEIAQNNKNEVKKKKRKSKERYLCKYCNKPFDFQSSLKRHLRTHTNERPFQCIFCTKSFKQKGNLMTHIVSVHHSLNINKWINDNPFNRNNNDNINTNNNKTNNYQQNRQIQIDYILKIQNKSEQKQMMKCNSNNVFQPFSCNLCRKRFSQKCHLVRHQMSHSKERPFQCDICFQTFKQSNNLTVHYRTHKYLIYT